VVVSTLFQNSAGITLRARSFTVEASIHDGRMVGLIPGFRPSCPSGRVEWEANSNCPAPCCVRLARGAR
ncbi:MAG TPA: hypothetical protein PLF42_15385, partial [Anaerolineales bacterium]|nr:hypothetical protein [Anaerolineales bacterium]